MQQIRRILDMVAGERLGAEDATRLLEALSPRLALKKGSWDHLFALLHAGDFSADELTALLESRVGARRFKSGITEVLENLPGQISGIMQHVHQAVAATRTAVPASMLRIEIKHQGGGDIRANLPLSLADHAVKLIPQPALQVLAEHGIDLEALRGMTSGSLPPGDLVEIKAQGGGSIRLWVE